MAALVAVTDPRGRVVVRGGGLCVEKEGNVLHPLRTHDISELHLHGNVELSAPARNLLLQEGIDVVFFTAAGNYRGRMVAAESRQGARRLAQYQLVTDAPRRLALARSIVAGKVHNQRAVLLPRQRRLKDETIGDSLAAMRGLTARILGAPDLDHLRGIEGLAAKHYFAAFARSVQNSGFRFDGRNRRPPRDPINACLSFGYTLLVTRVEQAVRSAGLDPYLGCLHEAGRGAPVLALDLVEEVRPVIDALVLTLVNRKQLAPEDFRVPPPEELGANAEVSEQAVYLGPVARAILIRALEARLNEPTRHPLRDDLWPLRQLLVEQALQITRIVEGDAATYQPLVLGG